MKHSLVVFFALLLPLPALAQSGWIDIQGNSIPESAAAKSRNGFSATVVITPDKQWQKKWDTPPETIPHFSESKEVGPGGELFILTFLSNPKVDPESEMTDVVCDFIVLRPDGSDSTREIDMPCFKTRLPGDPKSVYLSAASLKYIAEDTDPRGTWTVTVVVKDLVRKVEIPLQTSFAVK